MGYGRIYAGSQRAGMTRHGAHLVRRAGGVAYNYAGLFGSIAATSGFVYDGGAGGSQFFEDSAGTTPAATHNVSPVGRVTDVSGLGNHGLSTTSESKTVFRTDGVRRWLRTGYFSAASRYIDPTSPVLLTAAYTEIALVVYRADDSASGNYMAVVSTYRGGWGAGGYHRLAGLDDGLGTAQIGSDASPGDVSALASAQMLDVPTILVVRRAGIGANQTVFSAYDLAGTLIESATSTQDASPDNAIVLGYIGTSSTDGEMAFVLHCDKDIGAENEAAVVADLAARFGAWVP